MTSTEKKADQIKMLRKADELVRKVAANYQDGTEPDVELSAVRVHLADAIERIDEYQDEQ